jgi:hypothetical protein
MDEDKDSKPKPVTVKDIMEGTPTPFKLDLNKAKKDIQLPVAVYTPKDKEEKEETPLPTPIFKDHYGNLTEQTPAVYDPDSDIKKAVADKTKDILAKQGRLTPEAEQALSDIPDDEFEDKFEAAIYSVYSTEKERKEAEPDVYDPKEALKTKLEQESTKEALDVLDILPDMPQELVEGMNAIYELTDALDELGVTPEMLEKHSQPTDFSLVDLLAQAKAKAEAEATHKDYLTNLLKFRLGLKEKSRMKRVVENHQEEFQRIEEEAYDRLKTGLYDGLKDMIRKGLKDEKGKVNEEEFQNEVNGLINDILTDGPTGEIINVAKSIILPENLIESAGQKYEMAEYADQFAELFNKTIDEAQEEGLDLSKNKLFFNQVLDYQKSTNLILTRLRELAKSNGIEGAVELLPEVTKELFPTREEFLEYKKDERSLIYQAMNSMCDAIAQCIVSEASNEDAEEVEYAKLIVDEFKNGIDLYYSSLLKVSDIIYNKEADAIYGAKSSLSEADKRQLQNSLRDLI